MQLPPQMANIPGPVESHRDPEPTAPTAQSSSGPLPLVPDEAKEEPGSSPLPPIPPRKADTADEGSDDESKPGQNKPLNDDPYSNLGSAFGNYLSDQPQPMDHRGKHDDDLLF